MHCIFFSKIQKGFSQFLKIKSKFFKSLQDIHSIHAFANFNFNLEKSISIKFPKSHSKIDFLKIWICQWYFKYFPNSKFDFLSYISKFEFKEIKFFKAISHFSKSIFTKTSRFFRNRFSLSQIQYLNHDSWFSRSLFFKNFQLFSNIQSKHHIFKSAFSENS